VSETRRVEVEILVWFRDCIAPILPVFHLLS
jgi:hypothetical protein